MMFDDPRWKRSLDEFRAELQWRGIHPKYLSIYELEPGPNYRWPLKPVRRER